jgi:hypothetical protein
MLEEYSKKREYDNQNKHGKTALLLIVTVEAFTNSKHQSIEQFSLMGSHKPYDSFA